jgi:hypothetical protein
MSNNDENEEISMVKKHASELGEHFDTVQIFCTRHESGTEDGTVTIKMGTGNWFARYGQVVEWVKKQDERSCINERTSQDVI